MISSGQAGTCAPGLYPRDGLPPAAPPSEKKVYSALADALPPGWYAWHSVHLRSEEGGDTEADFVIAAPGTPATSPPSSPFASPGILILEVKGGAIRKQNGRWFQNGVLMPLAPRIQAMRCRQALISKFQSRRLHSPGIGEAVVFPDQLFDDPPSQGDLEGLVVGARKLPYLKEMLPSLIHRAIPAFHRRNPDAGWIGLLHDLWCEAWPLKPNLACQARARLEERAHLDTAQFAVLSAALDNDLVLVRGGAGTGKTLLAAELARREAAAGRAVLLLTFTEALGRDLAASLSGSPLITVSPVGRLALERLRAKGFDQPERYEPEFWNGVTRQAAGNKSLWKTCRFDTVIIDEAQDFGADEWRIATQCAGRSVLGRKRFWVFMDESQAFWEERTLPRPFLKKCARLNLEKAYRCPPGIQALADAYVGKRAKRGEAGGVAEAHTGVDPGTNSANPVQQALADGTIGVIPCDPDKVHEAVGVEINRLLAEGFKPTDIAVISLRGRMFEGNIMHRTELGGHPIALATDDRAHEHIVCDTFLRYKGLERLAVIITDLCRDSSRYPVRMNIAISRAVGILRIIAAREEITSDAVLDNLRYQVGTSNRL